MGMPWVCIVPKLPSVRLRAEIVATLDPTDALARQRLAAVNFSLEGFTVSGARLKGVAAAVGDGRIGVEVGNTGPNFAAAYSTGPDRHFTLGKSEFQPDDNWRSQIVHEAVHAAFDLAGEHPPNEIDEAAAYLGETAWFSAGGLARIVSAPDAAAEPAHYPRSAPAAEPGAGSHRGHQRPPRLRAVAPAMIGKCAA